MKEEIKYLNVARGILISLVVIGHIEVPTYLSRFIYLFHIAALFFISGYFSSVDTTSIKNCCLNCLKRVSKLYIYYLKYELLFLIFKNFFLSIGFYSQHVEYGGKYIQPDTISDFIANIVLIFCGMGREVMASAFWYFISLIFAIIIFTVIRYISDHQKRVNSFYFELISVFVVFIMGCACNFWDIYLPRLAPALTLILPFYWGYLQATKKIEVRFDNPIILFLSFIALVLLSNYGSISMNANMFPNPIFFILATFCGIYMVIGLSKLIDNYLNRVSQIIRYIGKRSVAIMIFHIFSFKLIFLLQYVAGEIPYSAISQNLGNPNGSFIWFVLFFLSGIYFSILLFNGIEKMLSLLWDVKKKLFKTT